MIDFHCHLDLFPDPVAVAQECKDRAIYVLSVTTTPSAWDGTRALASAAPRIRTALGLHPQLAHERRNELALFDQLLPKTRYVGEVGLDGSAECKPFWSDQVAVFEHILRRCQLSNGRKVLSIHSRRAASEVLDCLEAFPQAGVPILHWFTGSPRELDRAVWLGCWFSVGPAMLASAKGRALFERMPRDRVLTESDGPFAKIGGVSLRPLEAGTAEGLASTWGMEPTDARQIVLQNLRLLVDR